MSKNIGTLLTNIHIIPQKHQWKMKVFAAWNDIIGHLKDKVRIESIQEHAITLGVCHPAWAQELHILSPMLKKKINSALSGKEIKTIHFRTVNIRSSKSKKPAPFTKTCIDQEYCLTIVERAQLESVPHADLRHSLEQFYIRCKKIGKK